MTNCPVEDDPRRRRRITTVWGVRYRLSRRDEPQTQRAARQGVAPTPESPGTRAIVVLGIAVVSAAVAAGGYRSVREQRLKGFEERSRHDVKLFLALLVPSLPAAGIPDLVAVYNRESQSEAAARVGGEIVSSPSGLSLPHVPRDVRAAVEAGRTSQAQMTISGARYLVIGGQAPRQDTQVYFFYPQAELGGELAAMRPVFVAGWLAVVVLAVALANLVAHQRIRALSLAHERERRFTADVAHELRTPLGGMVTAASLLQEQLQGLPDRARRAAEVLITETRRLRQLVDDLMELARLEAGGHRLRVERLSLASAVAAVVARGWQTQVTLDMDEQAVIAADRAGLTRIILNLLGNALQHGGDSVKVRVLRDRDTAVRARVAASLFILWSDPAGRARRGRSSCSAPAVSADVPCVSKHAHDMSGNWVVSQASSMRLGSVFIGGASVALFRWCWS